MMSNFIKQQEERKEAKDKERLSHETLGKFFFDLAKIVFTALVVGSIISIATEQKKLEYWGLIIFGIFVTYIFSYVGNKILKS